MLALLVTACKKGFGSIIATTRVLPVGVLTGNLNTQKNTIQKKKL